MFTAEGPAGAEKKKTNIILHLVVLNAYIYASPT